MRLLLLLLSVLFCRLRRRHILVHRLRPELDQRVDRVCVGERVRHSAERRTCFLAHPGLGVRETVFAPALGLWIKRGRAVLALGGHVDLYDALAEVKM